MRARYWLWFGVLSLACTGGVLTLVVCYRNLAGWSIDLRALHAAIEATSSLAAIITALLLLQREPDRALHSAPLAAGLIGMGILDGLHSVSEVGHGFVLLHALSSLVGGCGFAWTWIPERARRPAALWRSWLPALVAIGSLTAGLTVFFARPVWPAMVHDGAFTPTAIAAHHASGLLFLLSIPKLFADFRRHKHSEDFLFAWMGLLFGTSSMMFAFSSLWEDSWWIWHGVRWSAFLVALWLSYWQHLGAMRSLRLALEERRQAEAALQKLNAELEARVHSRTLALENELTERQRAEAAAQRAVHAREDLLAAVSHDLRNPLSALMMNAQMLEHPAPPGETGTWIRDHARKIVALAERMEHLIRDLLDAAAIEAERFSLSRTTQEARPLVDEALLLMAPLADQRGLRLEHRLVAPLPRLACDRDAILRVFSNLIGNAIKFTPEGGTITVAAAETKGEIVFSVADTGPGIPAEAFPHLFDRYWQAKRAGRSGAGLGLYIVKGIVEAHGGRVWAESQPGAGSTFFFSLPAGFAERR